MKMDDTIYSNVADIHLKSIAYLTVTIIYISVWKYASIVIMLLIEYSIFRLLLMIDYLGIDW